LTDFDFIGYFAAMQSQSFWWRVIKRSFKNAWEPFGSIGRAGALIAGMAAVGSVIHIVTHEWGGDMVYWTMAVPVVVWCLWFCWHLIKVPRQILARDSAASKSGQKLVPFLAVVGVVSAAVGFLAVENYQTGPAPGRLPPPPKPEESSAAAPVPDTIIPRLESPPAIVPAQQLADVEQQKQLATNPDNMGDANSGLASELAESEAEKAANIQRLKLNAQTTWQNNLPIYNFSLKALYDILAEEAKEQGGGIAKTAGYFQCLPTTLDHEIGETNAAEIRFQADTNLDFKVAITRETYLGEEYLQSRGLKITCSCGDLQIIPIPFGGNDIDIRVNTPDRNESKSLPSQEARDDIEHGLKVLVVAEIEFLKKTNQFH
jgi:hypothetical protein